MVRKLALLGCLLLALPLMAQPARQPSLLLRVILTQTEARTDRQGFRCVVGTVQMATTADPPTPSGYFVQVPTVDSSEPELSGSYLGALAVTADEGSRLLFLGPVGDASAIHSETVELEPGAMEQFIRRALVSWSVVTRVRSPGRDAVIAFGKELGDGCSVTGGGSLNAFAGMTGSYLTMLLGIEGKVQEAHTAPAQQGPDPRERVVNVRNAKGASLGAGVILGKAGTRLYIITAKHVAWAEEQKVPDISVAFHALAGESFPATVLDLSDDALDLAVLSIPASTSGLPEIEPLTIGNPRELKLGSDVRSIGHPGGALWKMAATPEKYARRTGSDLEFESLSVEEGSSGGALFNGCNALVGMVRQAGTRTGLAVPIDRILDQLADWNIELESTTKACTGQ
jgi:S1-C subfamily serine protease